MLLKLTLAQKVKRIELRNLILLEENLLEQDIIVIIQDQNIKQDIGVVENGKDR
jgi:hypothetical protein